MDKKEIYEHLARIYLDASSNKKRTKTHLKLYNNLFVISLLLLVGAGSGVIYFSSKGKSLSSETALFILPDPAKINFNFNPVKKESFTINLNRLNLKSFKELGLAVKNTDKNGVISLRVEFINSFKEKSEVYLKNIPVKWQDFRISFLDFKNITDWSEMQSISFTVEEWNARKDRGILYIDNVRFLN
ncbi:MAG: hypothetical protein JXL82_00170 [Candidatus Omnitrophica bacterium]|nr:hypothetical protein [Candidatus Omnitrophota bacterium]